MPQTIALALFTLGAPLAVVNFVAVGFGATLISLGVSAGLSLLSAALLSGSQKTARLKPSDGQQTIRQAVPPRWKHYGRVRIGGPQFWLQSEDTQGYLYQGLVLNQGRIDAFEAYHIDDSAVEIDGTGLVLSPPFDTINVKLRTKLGLPTETAYTILETQFGYSNIRGDGIASILGEFDNFATAEDQQQNYPNGLPKIRATIRSSVVWDPREVTQDRTDKTTWGWSDNPVICLLDYMMSPDGFGLPWGRFQNNINEWISAANECDELVWSAEDSLFEKRYRIAASYLFTDDPIDVLKRFEETFDGRTWQRRDGSIGVSVGIFKGSEVTIDNKSILRFDLERGQDRLTAIAGVRAQYMSPANDYRENDAEPWPDGETVIGLSDDRVANLELTWVPSHGQARRLMQKTYERGRARWRGQIITNLSGMKLIDERYARFVIDELNIDENFEIDHFSLDLSTNEIVIDVTSVEIIDDPVRPPGALTGLFYRGSGHHESNDSVVDLDITTVDDGDAAKPGDLVVISLRSRATPAWVDPSGWTIIDNNAGGTREVLLFKEIIQADIDSPASPLSSADDTLIQWFAFNPALTGTPTLDLLDIATSNGNPAPVSADATAISSPHLMFSTHGAIVTFSREITSANWTGAVPDFSVSQNFETSSIMSLLKVYPDGAGSSVLADMNDEGSENYQAIFVIKYQ